jgi:phosphoglycolate phosphatase
LKYLIWDLDGTLIDSQKEILHHLELALKDSSLDIADTIKPIRTGPPIDIMLRESFPSDILTDDKVAEILFHFRKRYDTSDYIMTEPFAGIDEIISDTTHFIHHIVTNKPENASRRIIKKIGWENKITSLKTPSDKNNQKQSKTILLSELITGSSPSMFVGIGDMKGDCIAAKENNIVSVGVLWGSGTREELSDCCDYIFGDTKQLRDYLYDN